MPMPTRKSASGVGRWPRRTRRECRRARQARSTRRAAPAASPKSPSRRRRENRRRRRPAPECDASSRPAPGSRAATGRTGRRPRARSACVKPRRSQNSTVTSASRGARTCSASCPPIASSTTGEKNWLRLACRVAKSRDFAQAAESVAAVSSVNFTSSRSILGSGSFAGPKSPAKLPVTYSAQPAQACAGQRRAKGPIDSFADA